VTGNATFWKRDQLELCWEKHRSRILSTGLKDAEGRILGIVNCHLEGHPRKSLARVKQLQVCSLYYRHVYTHTSHVCVRVMCVCVCVCHVCMCVYKCVCIKRRSYVYFFCLAHVVARRALCCNLTKNTRN
jgi:hypothetical protein